MKDFLFLMHGDQTQPSPEEMQGRMQHYMEWMKQMMAEGRFKAGQPLEPSGALVKADKSVVTDGPFLEPKEMIGGYIIMSAESLEEATELARGCPLLEHCQIFVRPLVEVPS